MPFDTAYIIGVIRSWEKDLLQSDEYTRMIDAPSTGETLRVLANTPYVAWFDPNEGWQNGLKALDERLVQLQTWLEDALEDKKVLRLLQARYDAMNIVTSLFAYQAGLNEPTELSRLGSLAPASLQGMIWHDLGWDQVPEYWETFIRLEKKMSEQAESATWKRGVLERSFKHLLKVEDLLATTSLGHKLTQLTRLRWKTESQVRSNEAVEKVNAALAMQGMSEGWNELIKQVREEKRADQYELKWDQLLMEEIRSFRYDPVGYDPIIAFWVAVNLEVKTIRMIILSKRQRLGATYIRSLVRPLYLSFS